uniref:hypothetical protein n=1 Tax=Fulvivirga sp. TaxID=1931237 RepID=UPI0040499715
MMELRKVGIWIFALILAVVQACSPTDEVALPNNTFVKYYGRNGLDAAKDMKYTPVDGGAIILGERGIPGSADNEILLIKTDSTGNILFENTLGASAGLVYTAARVQVNPSGGYFVGGSVLNTAPDQGLPVRKMFILKVDNNLQADPSWGASGFREYGKSNVNFIFNGDLVERAGVYNCFDLQLHETGIALIGSTNDIRTDKPFFSPTTDNSDIAVLILDFVGDTIFTQRIGYPGEDIGYSIIPLPAQKFAIMGMTTRSAFSAADNQLDGQNILFNIVDANGQTSTNKIYGSTNSSGSTTVNDAPVKMIQDGLGFAVLANDGTSNAIVIKLTESGIRSSTSNLDLETNSIGRDLIRAQNGGYFLVGSLVTQANTDNNVNRGNDIMLMTLDQNLVINSDKVFHYGGRENDVANAVVQLPSQKLLIVGTVDFENGNTMIALMKTNSSGQLMR